MKKSRHCQDLLLLRIPNSEFRIRFRELVICNDHIEASSSRIDKAGVWWASMPFGERMRYASFLENRELIESRWHPTYGDRLNEIVFIGQDMNKEEIIRDLNACLD
jgi:G3E family GTPase